MRLSRFARAIHDMNAALPWNEFKPDGRDPMFGIRIQDGLGRYDPIQVRKISKEAWSRKCVAERPIFRKRLSQVIPEQIAVIWACQRKDFPRRLQSDTYQYLAWLYWERFQLWRKPHG